MAKLTVENATVQASLVEAAKNGETIIQLADRLGMKQGTLTGRIQRLKSELEAAGATPEQVATLLPKLARVKGGGRPSSVKSFVSELLAK